MNRKTLCGLIGLSLAAASFGAQAQDFDDRYYFAPWIGYYSNDEDRRTDDGSVYGSIGIGRFIAPRTSIDVFVDRTTRSRDDDFGLGSNWDNNSLGVSLRQHFGDMGSFSPYVVGALGMSHHDVNGDFGSNGWDPFAHIGVGLSTAYNDNVRFRAEVLYRHDWDDENLGGVFGSDGDDGDGYGDWMLNLGLTIAIGGAAEAVEVVETVEEVPAPVADCTTMDDDNDGVNNCDDKCPGSTAGQIVGPDGCPVPEPAPEEAMPPKDYKG